MLSFNFAQCIKIAVKSREKDKKFDQFILLRKKKKLPKAIFFLSRMVFFAEWYKFFFSLYWWAGTLFLCQKFLKDAKKQGAVFYSKKKFPTFFVLSMGHEIFRLVVLLCTFLFNSKKNVCACVRASVRPSVRLLLFCL